MHTITFEERGRKRVIERRLAINCVICGASLPCPPDADFWAWLKCGDANVFRAEHAAHGNSRTVGAEIKMVAREENYLEEQ